MIGLIMFYLLRNAWALLLGMLLLMIGNGVQGTLLGIRGSIEGFPPDVMSYVMSAYMLGMLIGSQVAPILISQVGHVRVFAALASLPRSIRSTSSSSTSRARTTIATKTWAASTTTAARIAFARRAMRLRCTGDGRTRARREQWALFSTSQCMASSP